MRKLWKTILAMNKSELVLKDDATMQSSSPSSVVLNSRYPSELRRLSLLRRLLASPRGVNERSREDASTLTVDEEWEKR